ncbi:MAG: FecR domain-containing protein [Alkalispirochaeta sp.]
MKRILISCAILALFGTAAWAQAEFSAVNGKVEIRPAVGGDWTAAEVGMEIDNDTTISTGFNASATLSLGASTVEVQQLTRMVFEEIVEQSDTVETRMDLNVGRMSAQVRSSDGRRQDFRVRSPISTAAVRGTDFEFDGEEIEVSEGVVVFVNNFGQQRSVAGGQKSRTGSQPGGPSKPSEEAQDENSTSTEPTGAGSDDEDEGGTVPIRTVPPGPRATRGSVTVTIVE